MAFRLSKKCRHCVPVRSGSALSTAFVHYEAFAGLSRPSVTVLTCK